MTWYYHSRTQHDAGLQILAQARDRGELDYWTVEPGEVHIVFTQPTNLNSDLQRVKKASNRHAMP